MPTEKELMLKQADAETTYQKKLTAGTNITIDPVTNVISSAGGGSTVQYTDNVPNGESVGILAINGQSHPIRIPRLAEGTGITITKDISTNVYTISSTGGGSGTTKSYMGETDPDELVGEDGDLYFKYHKIITVIPTELTLPSLPDEATVPFPINNFNSYESFTFYYTDLNREPHSRTVNTGDLVISDSPADESPNSNIYTWNSYRYIQATRSTNGEGLVLRVCGNCLYKLEANVTEVDLGIDKSYAKVEDTWLPSGEQVEANPEETSETPLTKIKIDGVTYYIAAGGTNVIPNPEGTPTDELHSLQIGDDIYEIVGGGGSGEGYSETLLYKYENGTTVDGIKTLNDDITNYDLLLFRLIFNVPTYTDHIISVSALEQVGYIPSPVATGPHVSIVSYASDYIRIVEGETKNKINIFEINGNEYIDEIYGIKIEGGGGSTDKVTKVYDVVPSGEGCSITVAEHIWLRDSGGSVSYSTAEYPDITSVDNFIARLTQTAMDDGSSDYNTNITFTFDDTNKTVEMSWDTLSGSSGCYVDIVYSLVEPVVVASDVEVSNTNTVTYDISSIIPAYQTLTSKDFMFNLKHIYSDNDGLGTSSPFNINFNSNIGVLTVSWNDIGTNNVLTGDILLLYKEDGYKLIKDMQPPTETSSGYHGYVPAPKIGDENKFLRGDGTWSEGGSSNVEANPAGTPTDTLSTIGIDGTIYNIEGSGGGGSSFIMDELYTGTSEVPSSGSTVSLSKSIDNYDFIMFDIGQNTEHTHQFFTPDSLHDSTNECLLFATNGGYCDVYASTSTELTFGNRRTFDARLLYSVYGLKFGSGSGGGSQELISYDTTITTTQYGWWTAEDKDGNTLDPDQYELIAVTPLVNNSSSWVGAWDGAFYINNIDGITDRYDVTFVNINDGGYIRTSRTWDVKVIYRDKNAAGGGGGSTVVPNPQEEPTDTLNTVEIDGVVYDIEGGSEGGQGLNPANYSTEEEVIGVWTNNLPVYKKTWTFSSAITVVNNSWADTSISVSDTRIHTIVNCEAVGPNGQAWTCISATTDEATQTYVRVLNTRNTDVNVKHLTLYYIKDGDSPIVPPGAKGEYNYYGGFIDTSNIIDSGSYQGSFTYTATEDCFVNVAVVMSANDSATITIDGEVVTSGWCASLNTINPILPLKKGQTLVATASASNTSNYTVYGITYASGGSESGSSKVEYSTNEHIVGTWIDGRDVYEKTIYYSSLQGRGSFLIDNTLTSSDVDFFATQDVSYIVNNNYISGIGINLEVCANTQGVFLDNNNAPSGYPTNFTDIYVTIRYVKKVAN